MDAASKPPSQTALPGAAVHVEGLVKTYHSTRAVDGVDLEIPAGRCFGLLGPNGAGKTTLLRLLLGLTAPDAGRIRVLDEPVPRRAREVRARCGVLPQADALDPDFTVRENLTTWASYFGRPVERNLPVDELLAFAALDGRANESIENLSGGMRRRLALARALVNDPELVILDEPTTGLDPQARQLIWQRLRGLLERGCSLILTTHYMEEAERLCDSLALIDHGRVIAGGSPRELVAQHMEEHVIELRGRDACGWVDARDWGEGIRLEATGDTRLLYARDSQRLVAALEGAGENLHWIHRRTGLEDVFLSLTGRELRD